MAKIRKPIFSTKKLRPSEVDAALSVVAFDEAIIRDAFCEEKKLEELNFNSCEVEGLSLQASVVEEIEITDSVLRKCNFTGVVTNRTFFERVHISNTRFQGSQFALPVMRDVIIEGSKCVDASFRFGKIKDSAFIECDLTGADFMGAELRNVIFRDCNLSSSQFSQSKLNKVSFKGSNIEGIAIGKDSLGGITVNTGQALYLASKLGFTIED